MRTQIDPLLTPGEVAALFRVDPKTVARWAADGRIPSIRTLGGHCRFRESEVWALLQTTPQPAVDAPRDGDEVTLCVTGRAIHTSAGGAVTLAYTAADGVELQIEVDLTAAGVSLQLTPGNLVCPAHQGGQHG